MRNLCSQRQKLRVSHWFFRVGKKDMRSAYESSITHLNEDPRAPARPQCRPWKVRW